MSLFDDKITKNIAEVAAKILNQPKPVVEEKETSPQVLQEIEKQQTEKKIITEEKQKGGKLFSVISEKIEKLGLSKENSADVTNTVLDRLHKDTFSQLIETYRKSGFKGLNESISEEVDNETFTKEIKDQQENSEGKKKKKIADAAVGCVQKEEASEELEERTLTPEEEAKKEKIVKSMKLPEFRKRYGEKGENVMYATATEKAKE
jgi:hypothetical protein